MESRRKNDFSQGSIPKNILSLAIPLTVAQLTVVLYNVVDRAFIGHIDAIGRDAFTGIGLVMPATYIITAFANLCGTGGAPLCSIARGEGDEGRASRIMGVSFTFLLLLGAVINLILDPLFIFVLGMGVRGAALATVIAQVCSAAWVLAFLTGRRAILRLDRGSLGLDGPILRRVCGLGLTGFTFSVTNSLVQAIGNAQLQSYGAPSGTGDLYVAAMTAITSVREIVFQPIRGLTQGAQPVLGYNYGAGRYGRVRESIRFLTVSCLAYNVVVWLLLLAFPGVFILLFNDDPALLEVGVKTMRIYYAAYVMMSFQMIGQNTFVALGRAKQAVFFSLWRKVVLVMPLMLVFPRFWGPAGVFAAEPVSDVVGGGICYLTMMATVGREMRERELAE